MRGSFFYYVFTKWITCKIQPYDFDINFLLNFLENMSCFSCKLSSGDAISQIILPNLRRLYYFRLLE